MRVSGERIEMAYVVTRRRVLITGVVLILVLAPLIIGSYDDIGLVPFAVAFMPVPKLEIQYVAANQTSRMIYCRLKNTGTLNVTLMEVWVDSSIVKTRDPLPTMLPPGYSYTYAFRYDGPWEGAIDITFHTGRYEYPKRVDLQEASENSIEEAFAGSSSSCELLNALIDSLLQGVTFESADARRASSLKPGSG